MGKKVAIVGSGNAGCITALNLNYLKHVEDHNEISEIEIYHDPTIPIERVGQGSIISVTKCLFESLNMNWYDRNLIQATIKNGILYENWGKNNHKFIHSFDDGSISSHYVPKLLQEATLQSKFFNVIEGQISDPDSQIDADVIVDCRGKPTELDDSYDTLTNPINSVILARKEGKDPDLIYTRCVATPNGWTFVIPNLDSVSYGYLYNNTITTKEEATADFIERFDVEPDGDFTFNNYVAKNLWSSERTILNGNRYSFIEPLEATSTAVHLEISEVLYDVIIGENTREGSNEYIRNYVKDIQDFILWHYKNGSRYNSAFWDYARTLNYSDALGISRQVQQCSELNQFEVMGRPPRLRFGVWGPFSFKCWYNNVGPA